MDRNMHAAILCQCSMIMSEADDILHAVLAMLLPSPGSDGYEAERSGKFDCLEGPPTVNACGIVTRTVPRH